MLAVARITDAFSDTDHIATGSGNVFINNLPCGRLTDVTTGHGCYPSVPIITGSGSVFCNGLAVARLTDLHASHCCVSPPHDCHNALISTGSGNVFSG